MNVKAFHQVVKRQNKYALETQTLAIKKNFSYYMQLLRTINVSLKMMCKIYILDHFAQMLH